MAGAVHAVAAQAGGAVVPQGTESAHAPAARGGGGVSWGTGRMTGSHAGRSSPCGVCELLADAGKMIIPGRRLRLSGICSCYLIVSTITCSII